MTPSRLSPSLFARLLLPILTPLMLMGRLQAAPAPAAAECPAPLAAQQGLNFPVGQTFYLPLFSLDAKGQCSAAQWKVQKAPAGNRNLIQTQGEGDYARFIPQLPGDYLFVNQKQEQWPLQVITRAEQPFINYNYYPTQALQMIADRLWVADTLRAEVNLIDPESMLVETAIPVGPWPVALGWKPGMDFALVVQKGEDSVGLIDVKAQRLVDSIWVGDEPANIVVAAQRGKAYIALSSDNQVVVLDLKTRRIIERIAVGADPQAMTLSPDESRLFVASRRSGKPGREPFGFDAVEDEKDIAVIDTESDSLLKYFYDVATTINSLTISPDGQKLYMGHLLNDTVVRLTDPKGRPFEHQVTILDAQTGARLAAVDLTRQEGTGGPAIALFALNFDSKGQLWVLSEGTDLLLQLNPDSLQEIKRVSAPSRPRTLLPTAKGLYVYSHQSLSVARYDLQGAKLGELALGPDPRPADLAAGQKTFTGAGQAYAVTWSCNSCHLDGGTDTNVWNAGPFVAKYVPRPIFWQEGTAPIGWPGYMSSVRNSGIEAHSIIAIKPSSEQGRSLGAYLSSLTVPPAANSLTERDGSLSAEALEGKEVFEGNGNCAGCHALPLGTNNKTLAEGITAGPSNIPSLVGAYRHQIWLKHGEAATLEAAIDAAAKKFARQPLGDSELKALSRYVKELTGRDFFVLASEPGLLTKQTGLTPALRLTFSLPLLQQAENLAMIQLRDAKGEKLPVKLEQVDARHLIVRPTAPLQYDSRYTLELPAAFKAWDGRTLKPFKLQFSTVKEPKLQMAGQYQMKIQVPAFNPATKAPDFSSSIESIIPLEVVRSEGGAVAFKVSYHDGLVIADEALMDELQLFIPPLPVPVFMGNMVDGFSGFKGLLSDLDGDGIADKGSGNALLLSGPGINWPGRSWTLEKIQP